MSAIEAQVVTDQEEERYVELQRQALDFARQGESEPLSRMLAAGMPVDLQDEKGSTLLMLASYNGNLDTTRMLLKCGASPDLRNDRGQTPLGGVAFKGYVDLVEALIKGGAEVNADNGGGKTPMLFATMFGRFKVRKILKNNGGRMWSRRS